MLSLRLGSGHAGQDTFANHLALEFAKHAKHLEHRLAAGSRGIDALLVEVEIDFLGPKLGEHG